MTRRAPTCHPDRKHHGRSMCSRCYMRWWSAEHPRYVPDDRRRTMKARDFAEDYAILRARMLTRRQIAERLNMTPSAVQKAYSRAVARRLLEPDSDAYRNHVLTITQARPDRPGPDIWRRAA